MLPQVPVVCSPHHAPRGNSMNADTVSAPEETRSWWERRAGHSMSVRRCGVLDAVARPWASHEVSRWPSVTGEGI